MLKSELMLKCLAASRAGFTMTCLTGWHFRPEICCETRVKQIVCFSDFFGLFLCNLRPLHRSGEVRELVQRVPHRGGHSTGILGELQHFYSSGAERRS